MPKPVDMTLDTMAVSAPPPLAAAAPRTPRKAEKPKNDTPVNFRWPASEVKAMKRAALDNDMTVQDYLLACFHAFKKSGN